MAELLPTSTGRAQLDALRTYEEHAAKGDAHGAFNCSVCYARGLGCSRDRDKALRFLRQAADGGLPQAQAQLAYLYSTGRGGIEEKNEAEAERWWRLAAAQGDHDAVSRLQKRGIRVSRTASPPPPPPETSRLSALLTDFCLGPCAVAFAKVRGGSANSDLADPLLDDAGVVAAEPEYEI